jgi:hypothetical protein
MTFGVLDDERDGHLRVEGFNLSAGKICAGVKADPVNSGRRSVEGADPAILIGAVLRTSVPMIAVLGLDSDRNADGGRSGGGIKDMR